MTIMTSAICAVRRRLSRNRRMPRMTNMVESAVMSTTSAMKMTSVAVDISPAIMPCCRAKTIPTMSSASTGTLAAPLVVPIANGRLVHMEGVDAEGPYAERLGVLFDQPENGTIAELGIGTNEAAKLCGIILEDEKLYGTVHIAFGTNTSFGGTTKAACHLDGIILKPTLYLDGECVIREGEFV